MPKAAAGAGLRETAPDAKPLEISASPGLPAWLHENRVSLAFTTYQSGKLFLVGLGADGRLSIFERTFNRCMGLCAADGALVMSTLYQLWRFENSLRDRQTYKGFDRVYVPINAHTTGDLDVHDIAIGRDGRLLFVNTRFSTLATLDQKSSFVPVWRPPFISALAPDDRCHLNGLALDEHGDPRYVTAIGESDTAEGWRDRRTDGGCVIEVPSGRIVARGLAMPHSPRLYRDRLWLLNSGRGEFGGIDAASGRFSPIVFCPGYLRGLCFVGDYAVVGLSKPREKTFSGLPLDDELKRRKTDALCAVMVISLTRGEIIHWLRLDGVVSELYDVVALPGVRRPMAIGFKTDEIRRMISIGEPA